MQVSDGQDTNAGYLVKHMLTTPVPQPPITSSLSQNSGRSFDPAAGNYTTTARDAMVNTVGPPLEILRSYNSNDPRTDQAFGAGWSSILDSQVVDRGEMVVLTYPNGREMTFGRYTNIDGSYTYISPAGRNAVLSRIDGGFQLWEKDGTRYTFLHWLGDGVSALSNVKDVHNREMWLSRVTDNVNVDTIWSASGRALRLTWSSPTVPATPRRVTQVRTDPVDGVTNTWVYGYSGNTLTSVCPPTSLTQCHTYEYTDSSLYSTRVSNTQPSSYWRLNEAGGESAYSSSIERAGADHGTYHSTIPGRPGPLAGSTSTATGFNGSTSHVRVPATLAGDGAYQAISMWFKAPAATHSRVMYGQSWDASTNGYSDGAYNPTLYIGDDGWLRGGFPVAPKPNMQLGSLLNPGTDKCVGVSQNSSASGAMLAMVDCNGAPSQQWAYTTDRRLEVTSGGVKKCIAPQNDSYDNVWVVTVACDDNLAQQKWDLQANGQIISDYSYKCLSVIGVTGNPNFTEAIGQRPCGTKGNSIWQALFPRLHDPMQSSVNVADDKWHHVVLSAGGNEQKMYIDGVLRASRTGYDVQDLQAVYSYLGVGFIGGGWPGHHNVNTISNLGNRQFFNGTISEVALYDAPVSERTVKELWAARNPVKSVSKVLRPSGRATAEVSYDGVTNRVSQVVDGNGATWRPQPAVVEGTTKLHESTVLAGAPTNYWRLADSGQPGTAANQVNGGWATLSSVTIGAEGPFGAHGTGASFNGSSSYVELLTNGSGGPSATADLPMNSISMWFKTTASSTVLFGYGLDPIQNGTTTSSYVPALYLGSDGKLRGQFWNGAVNPITSTAAVNNNQWHHVALVGAGNTQTLYVDGKAQGNPLAGPIVKANIAKYKYVGAGFLGNAWPNNLDTGKTSGTARPFRGLVGEVALYPGALDAKQVEAQFKSRDAVRSRPVPAITYSVQHADQVVSQDVHDLQSGRKLAEVDARGNETRFGYNVKGFLRTVTDPNGNMTINEHDVRGNVVSTATCQDRSENKCSTSYYEYSPDATTENPGPSVMNDRLLVKRGPGSTSATDNTYRTRYTYHPANAVRTSETDPLGRTTTIEYTNGATSPSGLPMRIHKPGGGTVSISYNSAGDITETTDPAGKTTRYEYDPLGRTTREIEVVGSTTRVTATYKHDKQDRVVEETGAAVTNQVTGAVHTPHTKIEYDDDGLPKLETVSDLTGGDAARTVGYEYDDYGRRKTETDALGKSVSLGYDAYGRVNVQTHADGSVVRTTYDAMGNEIEVNVDGEARPVKSMGYDGAGRLAWVTDAMGVITRYEYTDNNLLRKVNRYEPGKPTSDPPYVEEDNQYDAAGNLVSQTTNNGLTTTSRTYDAVGRGLTATLDPSGLKRATTHTYSPNDDVLTTTLTSNGSPVSRSEAMYDKLGRLLAETTYASNGLVPAFRWTFDEISGGSTPDTAGNTRGTVAPGADWSWDWGGSVVLNGAGATVKADQPVVDTSRGYTFGAWVKVDDQGSDRTVLSMPGAMELRYLRSNAWQLTVNGRTGTGAAAALTVRTADGTVTPNSWTQVAVTVDPATGTAAVYSSGTRVGSPATATDFVPLPATGIRLGDPAASVAQGGFEDLMAFQKALTAAEVMQIHQTPVAADQHVVRTSQNLDADGSVTSATDARGYTTYVTNDEAGRAAVLTAPPVSTVTGEQQPVVAVSTTRAGYNTFGDLTEQQDPNGHVTVMRYDAVGRLKETQLPNYVAPGTSTPIVAKVSNEYNAVGQVESTTDPLGATTSFEYDRFGRTTKVTAPDDGVSTFEYTANGDLLKQTDPTGAEASATYDWMGRTLTSTQVVRQTGEANTTKFVYSGSPWPSSVISPTNVTVKMGYNAAGEQNRLEDGAGNVTQTEFDGAGRPVKVTAPDQSYETATYDPAGRLTDTRAFSSGVLQRWVTSAYDAAGNLIEATDARRNKKTFAYDARGQLVSQTEPISGSDAIVSTFGYDASGQQTRFTDGRSNRFVTTYNSWGLPESQIEPATAAWSGPADRTFTMGYDKAARLVKVDSPGGVRVESEYDEMGRLKRNWGSGAQVATVDKEFEYDAAGRVTSLTGSAGATTVEYDDRGLPLTIGGVSGASSYTYHQDGALKSRTDAAGMTSYTYDNAGRQKTVVNTGAGVDLTYGYNNMSLVSSITHGAGGNVRSLQYDEQHRVKSDELRTAGGASVAKIEYGWDANSNLKSKKTTGFAGAATNTYTYDFADRLIGWDNGTTPVVYAYDKSGNRTQAGGETFQYDERNQLLSSSDGTSHHYSARGTLTRTVQNGQEQATVTDAFNQVVRQTAPGGAVSNYTYDGLGRVIKPNLTYTGLSNTVAGDSSATYVRDAGDGLVGVASGGTKRYAWTDLHTDVVGEFGGTGTTLTGSVSYDPWGKVIASAAMIGKLGFQSQWTDEGTGRVNMWARWYDPETGAFDTRDAASNDPTPSSGAANRFAYAEGDPLGNTDTTGYGVDGKCGTYDYECELKKYQGQLAQYNRDLEQHQRDVKFTGGEIARQEAEYQRSERESQTSLLDILLQVGVGMLLDMIGYNSLMGCLEGSTWDCIDLASNVLGPIKLFKVGKSLYRAVDRAFSGYRTWRRIIEGARTMMNRAISLMNQARKHLSDLLKKVPKKPKPPKKKIKPPAKKKPKPKPKPVAKPKPSEPAKPPKPKAAPKRVDKPEKERPNRPEREEAPDREPAPEKEGAQDNNPEPVSCPIPPPTKHSFDPDTLVLMADGSTRPISEVNVGDEVATTNPETGENSDQHVTLLHANRDTDLTDVTVSTAPAVADRTEGEGRGGRSTRGPTEVVLETTAHHPFWDATTGEWIDASDLTPGTSTLVGPDGQIKYVTAVRNFAGSKVMRDLTVASTHTYYVLAGNAPVLVHNNNDDCEVTVYRVEGAGNERVRIHEDGSVLIRGADKTLFLGFDDRARAEAFLAKRLEQGFSDTVIKSFRVRREFLDYLREDKVPESMSKAFPTRPISVDHPAKDQYGLKPFNIKMMVEYIVPNSGKIG